MGNPSVQRNEANKSQEGAYEPYPPAFLGSSFFVGLSQEDIDKALCVWNGNIESKHAVVRYMKDHAREKDTAAWLAQEYGGSNSPFVVRAGSPEETQLPWPKVE